MTVIYVDTLFLLNTMVDYLLLLASATPSTESYYAAQTGRYTLVELSERYNHMPLPEETFPSRMVRA